MISLAVYETKAGNEQIFEPPYEGTSDSNYGEQWGTGVVNYGSWSSSEYGDGRIWAISQAYPGVSYALGWATMTIYDSWQSDISSACKASFSLYLQGSVEATAISLPIIGVGASFVEATLQVTVSIVDITNSKTVAFKEETIFSKRLDLTDILLPTYNKIELDQEFTFNLLVNVEANHKYEWIVSIYLYGAAAGYAEASAIGGGNLYAKLNKVELFYGTYAKVKIFNSDDDTQSVRVFIDNEYFSTIECIPGTFTELGDIPVDGDNTHTVKIEWHDEDKDIDKSLSQTLYIQAGTSAEFNFIIDAITKIPEVCHTYGEMVLQLYDICKEHNSIAKMISLGKTYEGHDIWALKISDNVAEEEDEPEVLFVGCHHAREIITVETALYWIEELTNRYGKDQDITWIVNNREIWVIPMLNPDGHLRVENGETQRDCDLPPPYNEIEQPWRKNARPIDLDHDGVPEGRGVELTRNYG